MEQYGVIKKEKKNNLVFFSVCMGAKSFFK